MRVLCMLHEIQEQLGLTKTYLEEELEIDTRTITKLLADSDKEPWRLDRDALQRYVLFAHERGYPPFRVEVDPIWRSFENSDRVVIFRGPGKADIPVEGHLVKYFSRLRAQARAAMGVQDVEAWMKTQNCVFIGSPKANPASEYALSLLWGAQPFDARPQNRDRIAVHFLGMSGEKQSSLLREGPRRGLSVQLPNAAARSHVPVDWWPPEVYGPHEGDGQDAALLVACHRPLGTQENVTTVVIAGYTGLATLTATEQATYKRIPDLQPDAKPGEPQFAILKFRFKKERHRRGESLDNLRSPEEGKATWGPPWNGFFR
jgi:hypothetical protein